MVFIIPFAWKNVNDHPVSTDFFLKFGYTVFFRQMTTGLLCYTVVIIRPVVGRIGQMKKGENKIEKNDGIHGSVVYGPVYAS